MTSAKPWSEFSEASEVTSAKYRIWVRRSFGGDFGEVSELGSAKLRR